MSPAQINFVLPADVPVGSVTLTIDDGSNPLLEGGDATIVNNIAAGFFTISQDARGVAAATALRVRADGTQEPVTVFSCSNTGECSAIPIDLSSGLPVYVSLYGTGFGSQYRNLDPALLSVTSCKVAGVDAVVQFVGRQALYPGLDQLNLLLPRSLPSGAASIQCRFYGSQHGNESNIVYVAIK